MSRSSGKDGLFAKKQAVAKIDSLIQVFKAAARGWRILPIKSRDKNPPLINDWPKYATADKSQISEWSRKYPKCNWGLAAGPDSGVFVVDADGEEAEARLLKLGSLPKTFTVKTGRGKHFYFKFPPSSAIANSAGKLAEKVDVKSDRGYVLFPPSIHPSGAVYEIIDDSDPAPAPDWLLKRLTNPKPESRSTTAQVEHAENGNRITEGSRNTILTSMAGVMQRKGMSRDAIEAALLKENEKTFDPPVEENEVLKVVKSVTTRYEPADPETGEVRLHLGEHPYAQMVPGAESMLRNCPEERIFQTLQGRLVRVVQYKEVQSLDKAAKRDPEACMLVDVDIPYLRLALGRTGQVLKFNSINKCWVPTDAPRQLAEMILSSVITSPDKTSWRRLKKISVTPILLLDGTITSEPGYHSQSRIWIDTRGIEFVDPAHDNPKLTPKQCRKLIEETIYPFLCMYPFAGERDGQHWFETGAFAVVLSALMCIDDRHNLSAVPMHCVSAPLQSCGKTRLVEAIAYAATGTQPTIVTYDNPDEFAKHIPVLLGKGDSVICIDNIIMSVNNAKLAALLTQENTFTNRILGKSEDVTVENVSVLFATGVNLQLSGDMPTRCLLARIEPESDRPEQRKFPFNQVERAKALFPRAVMATKSLVRAHQLAGYPGTKKLKTASRFPSWDERVRAAIVWAGFADPILTQEAIRADDPVRNEGLRLLWILREAFRDEPFLTCHLSTKLSRDSLAALKQITGHKDGEELSERKVGKYFSHHLVRRWLEGVRLVKTGKNPGGRLEWRIDSKLDDSSFRMMEEPL